MNLLVLLFYRHYLIDAIVSIFQNFDGGACCKFSIFNTTNLNIARDSHTASVLTGGKDLVIGGEADNDVYLNTAELYDPSTGRWMTTGNATYPRLYHTASVLTNGKVLVTGECNTDIGHINTAELYDPSTGKWTMTDNLNNARMLHIASVLTNGKVLVTGGKQQYYYSK